MSSFDYLIVGQGIAGSVLAIHLMEQNKSVKIIDAALAKSASLVAAGIINPITGRKFIKTWKAQTFIPYATNFYRKIERSINQKILYQSNILRVIHKNQQKDWDRMYLNDNVQKYLVDQPNMAEYTSILKEIPNYGEITHAYRVDLKLLLTSLQTKWLEEEVLIQDRFDFKHLLMQDDGISYNGLKANAIIFCEGYQVINNPLFNYLPFNPAKGEAIRFKIPGFRTNKTLKYKNFISPIGEDQFWSGGGYEWEQLDEQATTHFLEKWKADMASILTVKLEILDHQAGVRPSVAHRRPLLGNHPAYKNAYIFNGMGTKGASLSPYWAQHFANYLTTQSDLDQEIDINRFAKGYFDKK